ncbi:Aldehyde/histidinol dehydrogenase [Kockovaella imperatae]|uniref:aldehyde dehydrogenase (NAD(+)) n=1 Tax=Kockovaella imperatae TaxID=4999 RepID=A0A1Y1UT87_9TREE|nr:Aldehyde/histidinol dehydrogenase [Kockovaella imperatae]ORX41162.1 Aldehyde/histidinol dehydrogenase [Kockovaella imperatae]
MIARAARLSVARRHLSARYLSTRAERVLAAVNLPTDGGEIAGVYDGSWKGSGPAQVSKCPATGEVLAHVRTGTVKETEETIRKTKEAGKAIRAMPAPKRGEVIRQMREALASKVGELGDLVSLEMGKIKSEGKGEVQEAVDICDYATGLSRSMAGRVLPSERPNHVIYEIPNPLGVVGILTAFNFPVAVHVRDFATNMAIAMAAGNACLWKPAPSTPLCAIAVTKLLTPILEKNGLPGAAMSLVCGDVDVGKSIVASRDVDLLSFTGSEKVGQIVAVEVQKRSGKVLLELGGNNAAIVDKDADLDLALQAVLFAAVGTAGQRCTTTRRLFLHKSIASKFLSRLLPLYDSDKLPVGDPLNPKTLIGPMHSQGGVTSYMKTLEGIKSRGGQVLTKRSGPIDNVTGFKEGSGGNWVWPTVVRLKADDPSWKEETFAPILQVAEFDTLEEAIELNNSVPQGLSSSLFTNSIRSMGQWLGPEGSDCGITNINVGTSGAEIGAAFGGNKSTGWGRESGGDAWHQYVRWSAATVNYSDKMPLAQGVDFGFGSS